MDYKKLYEEMINFDPKIRLITICDLDGKIMYSDHRQGVRSIDPRGKQKIARSGC